MGQPVKLIIKKGSMRKDGTCIVFIQYCHNSEDRVLVDTGVAIPPKFWNRKTGRIAEDLPIEFGHPAQLQQLLTKQLRKAEDMVEYALQKRGVCPLSFLKSNFHLPSHWELSHMADKEKSLDVFYHIDDYVKSKEGHVKKCTINVINAMKAHLALFQAYRKEPITFDSFDAKFYEDFVKYLTYDIPQGKKKRVNQGVKIKQHWKNNKAFEIILERPDVEEGRSLHRS